MPLRFAINSGSWSNPSIWSGSLIPTSSDDVYANGYTVMIDQNVVVASLRNTAGGSAIAGGNYLLADNASITTALVASPNPSTTLLGYTGSGVASIVLTSPYYGATGYVNGNTALFYNNGSGSLNFTGDIYVGAWNNFYIFSIGGPGTLNFTGNLGLNASSPEFRTRFIAASNINSTINFVGSITAQPGFNIPYSYSLFGDSAAGRVNITGTLTSGGMSILNNANSGILSIVGPITARDTAGGVTNNLTTANTVVRTSTNAINLFTGPFICAEHGTVPYYLIRLHLQPVLNNYFQFRDSSTGGVVSPGATGSIANLVSADTVISDQPIPANVRAGVSYGSGAYVGTMAVPNPANVRLGIQVDNTTGSAVLAVEDIWNYNILNLTGSNSIGNRLRTVSTVGTTGAQIAGFRS